MKNSAIEWCDHTFNPWEGCTKVSPGCAHCYAEARNQRFGGGANWGPGAPRRRTSVANWKQPLAWNKAADPGKYWEREHPWFGYRPKVFCASLADWLDDEVPVEWLRDLLSLIGTTGNLDWLLLSKRPELFGNRMKEIAEMPLAGLAGIGVLTACRWLDGHAPSNIWLGTTVENQTCVEERIPHLRRIPARVRFLSCEPLLGQVDIFTGAPIGLQANNSDARGIGEQWVDWLICGGESGPRARPMHPEWARGLRDQCKAVNVPFFFKQWGEWLPACQYQPGGLERLRERGQHTFDADNHSFLVGKHAAGRLLDGVEHNGCPA